MSHCVKIEFKFKRKRLFRRVFPYFKKNIELSFVYKTFIDAYLLSGKEPDEFDSMPQDETLIYIVYCAAVEGQIKNNKKIFFTLEDIANSFGKLTRDEIMLIGKAIQSAQMPEWLFELQEKASGKTKQVKKNLK